MRGVNLSGSAKVPIGSPSQKGETPGQPVSFVGRPLVLADAEDHLLRIKALGFRLLRLVVTWEAIEHEGPGRFDRAYLAYLQELVGLTRKHGLWVWIDPHQDVWSRFTGGDGAPKWTLSAVGMKPEKMHVCGAAVLHSEMDGPFPTMIWPTNYVKLGAATLFTLFFGGNDFAKTVKIDGEPVQEFLVRHYVGSLCELAKTLRGFDNVIGYGSMNEPSAGYVGARDLTVPLPGMIQKGPSPSPLQSMALAAGIPQEVENWEFSASFLGPTGTVLLNPNGETLWQTPDRDIWRNEGVWDVVSGVPKILRPEHFCGGRRDEFSFSEQYLKPFVWRVLSAIRSLDEKALLFMEGPPFPVGHPPSWHANDLQGVIHAGHFYDGFALMNKQYDPGFTVDTQQMLPVFGEEAVRESYSSQLRSLAQQVPDIPFLCGEFGIPFDLDGGESFRSGDFSKQQAALSNLYSGLDSQLLSGTLWNYTPDNTHELGDQFNGEDLSVYCLDQKRNTNERFDGCRALSAIVRPCASAIAGIPVQMSFDSQTRRFVFRFRRDPAIFSPTELFVSDYTYPTGFSVAVSDGSWEYEASNSLLIWRTPNLNTENTIELTPR